MNAMIPLLAALDDTEIGELAFYAVFASVMTVALIKCLLLLRRPTVSKCCLLSLALVFAWFIVGVIVAAAAKFVPEPAGAVLGGLAGLVGVVVLFGAIILAIIGLATYSSPRPVPHTQGRAQAIWTLVLTIIPFVALMGFGVFQVVKEEVSGGKTAKAGPVENRELNYRFDPPGRPWVPMNAKLHNKDAAMMYRKVNPETIFMAIVEAVGMDSGFSNESLADFARANLEANEGVFEFEPQPDRTVNGIRYTVFRTDAKNFEGRKQAMRWEHWLAFHKGYAYQLVFFTSKISKETLSSEAEGLVMRFHPADPGHELATIGEKVAPYRSPEHGLAIDLSSDGWTEFPDREKDYPEACFAASSGNHSTGATTLPLGSLDPGIDELASGFLAANFSFNHPEDTTGRKEIRQGTAGGIEVSGEREFEGDVYLYRFRILRDGPQAWVLAAWGKKEGGKDLSAILDRYEISSPKPGTAVAEESKAARAERAQILNQTGLAYYRREKHGAALPYYEAAHAIDPENAVYFDNVIDSQFRMGRYSTVVETVRAKPDLAKSRPGLSAYEGACLSRLERYEEAADAYAAAFENGHDDEEDLLDFVNVLVDTDQQERGIEALKRYRKEHPDASVAVERWQASLLSQLERHDEAIAVLEAELKKNPGSLRLSADLVSKRIDAGNHAEALAEVEKLLADGSRNAELLFLKGRAKLGLESYREARAAFEEARELSPDDEQIADYIEHTSTLLGKGDISLIRKKIEPVALPSEVAALAQELVDRHGAALSSDYGAVQLQRVVGVSFDPDKPQKTTSRTIVRITGPAGLEDFSTLQFSFDPAVESLYVNELVVTNEAGETVGTGDADDYFIVDDNGDELATTDKVVHVPVPGIAVGTTLSFTVTTEYHHPDEALEFGSTSLSSHYPSTGKIHYLVCDPKRLVSEQSDGVETLAFPGGVAFYSDGPPMWHSEPMEVWAENFLPWLTYADASLNWEDEAAEYLERLGPVLAEEDEATKAKAAELVAKETSVAGKIRALSDFVAGTLTYQGIEFGPRGRMPEKAGTILRNRYGDCKDHSLLLVRLLRSAGIEAHLALVSTDAPVKEKLASLDQFNHMIAYVPGAEASPFVDTTQDRFPFGELPPYHLLNEKALVLEPGKVRFETIAPTDRSLHRFDSRREIRVDPEDGESVVVEETLRLDGYMAAWFRDDFDAWRAPEYAHEIAGLLRDYGSPHIRSLEVEGLSSARGPLDLKLVYSVPSAVKQREGKTTLAPPAVWERYFLERRDAMERRNPFEIMVPTEFTSRATIVLPGLEPDPLSVKELAVESADDFGEWSISANRPSPGQVEIVSRARFNPGKHPEDRFREFVRSTNRGIETWGKTVVFDPAK